MTSDERWLFVAFWACRAQGFGLGMILGALIGVIIGGVLS